MSPPPPPQRRPRATALLFLAASLLAAPAAGGFIDPEAQQSASLPQTGGEVKASGGPEDGYTGGYADGDAPAADGEGDGGGDGEEGNEEGNGTIAQEAPAFADGLAGAVKSQALDNSAGRQVMGQFMNAFARNMRKSVLEDSRGDMPEAERQRLLREIAAQERGAPADAAPAGASDEAEETTPAEASRAVSRPRRRLRMLNGGRVVGEESATASPAQGAANADPAAAPRMLDGAHAQRSLVRMLNALGGGASPRPTEPASVHTAANHRRRRHDGFVVDRASGQHIRKLFSGGEVPVAPSKAPPADLRSGSQKVWESLVAGTWIIVTGLM